MVIQQRIRPCSPLPGVNRLCETHFIMPPQPSVLAATLLAAYVLTQVFFFSYVILFIFGVVIQLMRLLHFTTLVRDQRQAAH